METIIINDFKSEWDIPTQAWNKFVEEAIDYESDNQNFKMDFGKITKKYGRQFMEVCRANWVTCKEFMSEEEFCKMNANMPVGFFRAKIKD